LEGIIDGKNAGRDNARWQKMRQEK